MEIQSIEAAGPERADCADIPEVDPPTFHSLGGQDIVVWGTDYTIEYTDYRAIEYVACVLDLDVEEES